MAWGTPTFRGAACCSQSPTLRRSSPPPAPLLHRNTRSAVWANSQALRPREQTQTNAATLCFRTGVSLPSGSRAEPGAAGKQLCICPQGSPNRSDPEGSPTHVGAHAAEWATSSFHSACDLCNHPEKLPARKPCSFSRTRGLDARHSRNPSRVLLAGPRISVRTGVFSSSAPAFTCS